MVGYVSVGIRLFFLAVTSVTENVEDEFTQFLER